MFFPRLQTNHKAKHYVLILSDATLIRSDGFQTSLSVASAAFHDNYMQKKVGLTNRSGGNTGLAGNQPIGVEEIDD